MGKVNAEHQVYRVEFDFLEFQHELVHERNLCERFPKLKLYVLQLLMLYCFKLDSDQQLMLFDFMLDSDQQLMPFLNQQQIACALQLEEDL